MPKWQQETGTCLPNDIHTPTWTSCTSSVRTCIAVSSGISQGRTAGACLSIPAALITCGNPAAHAAVSSRAAFACCTACAARSWGTPGIVASSRANKVVNRALTLAPLDAETCNMCHHDVDSTQQMQSTHTAIVSCCAYLKKGEAFAGRPFSSFLFRDLAFGYLSFGARNTDHLTAADIYSSCQFAWYLRAGSVRTISLAPYCADSAIHFVIDSKDARLVTSYTSIQPCESL
jgi:hypothetical protein